MTSKKQTQNISQEIKANDMFSCTEYRRHIHPSSVPKDGIIWKSIFFESEGPRFLDFMTLIRDPDIQETILSCSESN